MRDTSPPLCVRCGTNSRREGWLWVLLRTPGRGWGLCSSLHFSSNQIRPKVDAPCALAALLCMSVAYAEGVRLIISTNIHRRHLTTSQRAMIASELAQLGRGQPSESNASKEALLQEEAADQMQVSRASVQRAREVQKIAPDLAAKVKSGEIKVSKAAAMASEPSPPTATARANGGKAGALTARKLRRAAVMDAGEYWRRFQRK